jgi:hypothetical protein
VVVGKHDKKERRNERDVVSGDGQLASRSVNMLLLTDMTST